MSNQVPQNPTAVQRRLEGLSGSAVAIDTETTDLRYDRLELLGISVATEEDNFYIQLYGNNKKEDVISIFRDYIHNHQKDFLYIFHNAMFDLKVLSKYGVRFDNAKIYDTMTAEHLIDEKSKKSLKRIAEERLGVTTEEFSQASSAGYNSDTFIKYALNDSRWTYDICQQQFPELEEEDVLDLMKKIEMPYNHVLLQMVEEGIYVDEQELKKQQKRAKDVLADIKTEICEEANIKYQKQTNLKDGTITIVAEDFNFNSPDQLGELLYDKLNLPVLSKTDTGKPSTDKATLKKLADKHKVPELLLEYRKVAKLKNSFLDQIPEYIQDDGRVRPGWKITGTVTGRLSASDPAMQTIPRSSYKGIEVRKIFQAPQGYQMISCDYDGQENRVAAHVCDEDNMRAMIEEGLDLHLVNANTVFDLGLSEEQMKKTHPDYKKIKEKYYEKRSKAKIFSYGILYGATHHRIQDEFNCSEEEAKEYLEKYYNQFPGVKNKKEEVHQRVKKDGFISSLFGRKRRFEKHPKYGYSDRAFRQAFNFIIQSPCADQVKAASIKALNVSRRNPEWDLKQVATIHDENLYIVKEQYAEQAKEKIVEAFETVVNLPIATPADADVGDSYGDAK